MKKHKGKAKQTAAPKEQESPKRQEWGYEEMLTELEAIVSDAEQRLEQEEQ
ncbi:hypothetical protein [Atlantibacter subterraneus]|jgi:exonuclease VII small subunit|uniref:hypothetical protein n=1 Tax=Atlantibacter subterraneus TaxID=255519 RepID=UPI0016398937|nr:hypothetical protein [Atlantibacter subterranea]MDA3132032.1 hypothetical protein [Atlantibacter subterranea]UTJ46954.1 hypothetical protein NLZ15_19340 [Atlantibacter subterranea]